MTLSALGLQAGPQMVSQKRPAEAPAPAAPEQEEDFPRGGGGALTALQVTAGPKEPHACSHRAGVGERISPLAVPGVGQHIVLLFAYDEASERCSLSAPTLLQRRQAREEGAAEAALDVDAGRGGSSSKKRRKGSRPGEEAADGEDLFWAREALQGRAPKYVELLKFKVGLGAWLTRQEELSITCKGVLTGFTAVWQTLTSVKGMSTARSLHGWRAPLAEMHLLNRSWERGRVTRVG